jgi:hypothetical protein
VEGLRGGGDLLEREAFFLVLCFVLSWGLQAAWEINTDTGHNTKVQSKVECPMAIYSCTAVGVDARREGNKQNWRDPRERHSRASLS